MLALLLILAPAPAQPPVTEDYLVGRWACDWNGLYFPMTFEKDGRVYGTVWYDEQCRTSFTGRWWIDKEGSLVFDFRESCGSKFVMQAKRHGYRSFSGPAYHYLFRDPSRFSFVRQD